MSGGKAFAIVDAEDYEHLSQWAWKLTNGAATRTQHVGTVGDWREGKRRDKTILMHRLVMNTPDGMDTDHINRNPLDNRKVNLRVCTHAENRRNNKRYSSNTHGYKGVYWNSDKKKWYAQIRFMNKSYTLAVFDSKVEAAKEYDNVAKQLFGEFATLNFGDK